MINAVRQASATLEERSGVRPGLAVIIVGDVPASHAYVNSKSRIAKQCGFKSVQCTLAAETSQKDLARLSPR
nr:tetrahydrofolate dehydrogenase/cyclohydrolase catalytic domain-containing protein [Agrobacterium tumefaciens]